jgi:hypothetical protein
MRRAWKIALPLTCAVLIGGTMTFEMVHRHQLEQQRLAEEAQAYRVRAEKGDAEAEFHLSTMYLKGWGVQQNYTEAARWCRKAADQNYAKAQDGMGYLYYHGYGVDGDFAEALRWFHLAADQKNAGAENEIGIAYEVGNGVTASPSEAVRWYQLAADQGYAAAQYNLGRLYAYGYGVPKDRLKARELMTKAADQGYLHAKQMLGRSWPSLSKIQIFELLIGLVGGVFLLTPSLVSRFVPELQVRASTAMLGLGVLFSVVLSLLSYTFAGILAPPLVVVSIRLARNLVGGILLSLLVRMIWRNSPKWMLWASGILFVAFNGIICVCCFNRLPTDAAVRLLISTNGMPLGLGITSAVLLLRAKRDGETDGPSGPDEIAGTEDGEPAH